MHIPQGAPKIRKMMMMAVVVVDTNRSPIHPGGGEDSGRFNEWGNSEEGEPDSKAIISEKKWEARSLTTQQPITQLHRPTFVFADSRSSSWFSSILDWLRDIREMKTGMGTAKSTADSNFGT
ncbi:hypothetical protein Ddc_06258 [Ditylenchus destructor]|nr:hypothetical protein Ddc_06258 [Ditylenchus destructor]